MKENSTKTVPFSIQEQKELEIRLALQSVYNSLTEKGYNPINQIVGYILSGDPTYITNHNNARTIITKIDRDELLKILVQSYLKSSPKRGN
ncbi:MAG: IreB family regulatory phosphoprotein [Clostridia bacterium]|nr:IreB family regulatory phosphoprotein [Clostridia bacterium]